MDLPTTIDERLIFVVSQPRAGSTLLQRMLACHPDVETTSEPALMMPALTALRPVESGDTLHAHLIKTGLQEVLPLLPGGDADYIEGVRRMYGHLYSRALQSAGKQYFCDKTPSYLGLLPALFETFPRAHYVVLLRNPLAVLASVVNIWAERRWWTHYNIWQELVRGPSLLADAIDRLGGQATVVRYEEMVRDPESEMRRLCREIGMTFDPEMIDYGSRALPRWRTGDPVSVYQHARPVADVADRWAESLRNPQVWRLARDYVAMMNPGTMQALGYPCEDLRHVVGACRPRPGRLTSTVSLAWLLHRRPAEASAGGEWDRTMLRLHRAFVRRGTVGAAVAGVRAVSRHVWSSTVASVRS